MPLTDLKIRQAKPLEKAYKLTDGHGLYLSVTPNGSKLWRYRYRLDGKENLFAIGEYPTISLTDARKARDAAQALVKQGLNPSHARRAEIKSVVAENQNTFQAVAREWMEHSADDWSDGYRRQVETFMQRDVLPKLGNVPIRAITAAHVLDVLHTVEKRGAPSIAVLIRQWCGQIFRYAVATARADFDPSAALRGALKRRRVRHHPPLGRDEMPRFLARLNRYGGYRPTVIAIRLLMLTFVRTVELRKAKWAEFDFASATWRVPAERMKMRKAMLAGETHIVPLSRQAMALLEELRTFTGGQPFLFPNMRTPQECMTATTINRALERMGYAGQFSAHGFRSTASTLLHEMGWRADVIERQLAHAERNKVRAAYNHAEYLPERREMMQAWADWIDTLATGSPMLASPSGLR